MTALADPENSRTHAWLWRPYAAEEGQFTQDTARQFFGGTCGMSERTRNRVVDQIDFTIADDLAGCSSPLTSSTMKAV